jgi:hypothetical protein
MSRKDAENSNYEIRESWASLTIQQARRLLENGADPEQAPLDFEKEPALKYPDRNARLKRKVIENALASTGPNRIRRLLVTLRLLVERLSNLVGASDAGMVKRAPGTRLLQIVDFLCSPTTVEQVFEPLVADWQKEYFDALHKGRRLKARWISVRYYWSTIQALGLSKVFSLLRSFTSAKK